ncbi:hypothetical protein CK203_076462 [Vitis vinifera]|uniref:Uncharacterized protein n=1 Tax=Vitis vinifera TaxID=29760 RepID=A0A438C0R4_VITVI|nr:hypothetical protein CK203_076462 [Vitis vinifera]
MSANKEDTSSSSSGDAQAEKVVDKLNVREFCERFCIPNGVSSSMLAPVPSAVVVQGVPSLHPDSSGLYSSQHGPGADGVQHSSHAVQSGSLIAGGSLHLFDPRRGPPRDMCWSRALWAGLVVHPDRSFASQPVVEGPRPGKKGKLVEWVEKASFDRLNRLFEIAAAERSCETLLSAQNLRSVVAGEHFVLKDLPFYAAVRKADSRSRKACLNKQEVKRQEGLLRKAPEDKRPASSPPTGAPTKKKKKMVLNKGKEIKLPTPPKEVPMSSPTFVKKITIREPELPALPSVSSGSKRLVGLNHSGPSVSASGRLALLAEEATSVKSARLSHPDTDAAGAFCAEALPPMAPPTEENGGKKSGFASLRAKPPCLCIGEGACYKESCPAHDLKSSLIGQLQDRFLETIEVSCSSVQDDHPEGSETEMAEENPTVLTLVPDGGSPGEAQPAENERVPDPREESLPNALSGGSLVDDAACISASPFSYAELGEMLKRIPSRSDIVVPFSKNLGERYSGMAQQRDLFSDLLRTADYMKAFVSQRKNSEEKLRFETGAGRSQFIRYSRGQRGSST